jgi:hypothetical protein
MRLQATCVPSKHTCNVRSLLSCTHHFEEIICQRPKIMCFGGLSTSWRSNLLSRRPGSIDVRTTKTQGRRSLMYLLRIEPLA